MILDYLGGPSVITRVLKNKEPLPAEGGGGMVRETGLQTCYPAAFGGRGPG